MEITYCFHVELTCLFMWQSHLVMQLYVSNSIKNWIKIWPSFWLPLMISLIIDRSLQNKPKLQLELVFKLCLKSSYFFTVFLLLSFFRFLSNQTVNRKQLFLIKKLVFLMINCKSWQVMASHAKINHNSNSNIHYT